MVPKYIIGESPFSPDGSIDQNKQTHVFGNEDPGIFPKLYELEYNGESRVIDPNAGDAFGPYLPEDVSLPGWVSQVTGPYGNAERAASPLVIDVDGDGIELSGKDGPGAVYWDLDQDGFREASGWIVGGNGLLPNVFDEHNPSISCVLFH